ESDLGDSDILTLKEAGKKLGHQVQFRSPKHAMERSKKEGPLAFISYYPKERDVARRISKQLPRIQIPVLYDEFSLAVGDNLRDKIELGISGLMHEDLTGRRGIGPGNLLGTLRILR